MCQHETTLRQMGRQARPSGWQHTYDRRGKKVQESLPMYQVMRCFWQEISFPKGPPPTLLCPGGVWVGISCCQTIWCRSCPTIKLFVRNGFQSTGAHCPTIMHKIINSCFSCGKVRQQKICAQILRIRKKWRMAIPSCVPGFICKSGEEAFSWDSVIGKSRKCKWGRRRIWAG